MSRRLIPLIILAVGIAGFLILKATRPEPPAASARERSWRVEVMTVEPATHTPVLSLYGELVAPEQTTLSATLAGRIGERPVREGQRVSEGDLLVALDSEDVQPAVAQAEADVEDLQAQLESEQVRYRNDQQALQREQEILENARKQLERTRSLVSRNLSSQEALDAAADAYARAQLTVTLRKRAIDEHPSREQSLEARLARAQAALESVRRDARRSRVAAPFDGIVTDIQVAPGDQVSRNAALLSIYPRQGLELRARVPEVFRQELQEALDSGRKMTASADGTEHRFAFSRFAGRSDPAGTEAILNLVGDTGGLRPGGLLPVTLERPPRPDTVAVPFSALYGADSLYLMSPDGRMERIHVQRIGEALNGNGERRVLVSGQELVAGRKLITTHLPNAMTGLKVQIAQGETGPEQ